MQLRLHSHCFIILLINSLTINETVTKLTGEKLFIILLQVRQNKNGFSNRVICL